MRAASSFLPRWEVLVGTLALAGLALSGRTDTRQAWTAVRQVLPALAFLVAVLVLARMCSDAGLFEAIGAEVARAGRFSPARLTGLGFLTAAVVTAVLNLDATVVLLGPVLVAAAVRVGLSPRPAAWTSVRLANSASTLLPVSNLTNLLAFSASGLTFLRFAWLMWPVWLVALAGEWLVLRVCFRTDLRPAVVSATPDEPVPLPRLPLVVVGGVLAGFVLGSPLHVAPAWPAAVGAAVLVAAELGRRETSVGHVLRAAGLPLAYFVGCWVVVVAQVAGSPAGRWVAGVVPERTDLPGLVTISLVAMVSANVVNNLPATLLLLPFVAPLGATAVLALLVGVNVGASLSYVGSLANLLWLRTLAGGRPGAREFHLLGLTTTPLIVLACASTLWAWTSMLGRT